MTQTVFCARVALRSCASRATSYQPRSAGPTAYRGGGGAERADGGRAGTPLQAGPPPRALGLGRRGAGEANTRHLVDGSEEPVSGHALEVSARNESRHWQSVFQENLVEGCSLQAVAVLIYLVPATAPSFFPRGSSSSTPHQSPLAKSVSPRNRTTPAFVPPTFTRKGSTSWNQVLVTVQINIWKNRAFKTTQVSLSDHIIQLKRLAGIHQVKIQQVLKEQNFSPALGP